MNASHVEEAADVYSKFVSEKRRQLQLVSNDPRMQQPPNRTYQDCTDLRFDTVVYDPHTLQRKTLEAPIQMEAERGKNARSTFMLWLRRESGGGVAVAPPKRNQPCGPPKTYFTVQHLKVRP